MRGIILALALTLVGSQKSDIDPGFGSRKTHVYSYEGWVLNGLQEKSLAKAGVRLSSKIEISGLLENTYILKIHSPQFEEYNGIWPRNPFTWSSKITQIMSSCFARPFKFEYSSGRIGNIYGPEDCPVTCINIVKGIMNMLQITIKKSQNVYELQEAGIGGVCHTRYVVQEDRKNRRVSVTKTVDQNNCQEKVTKSVGMAYIYPCPVDMMKGRLIRGTAAFSYKLKQSDSSTLITEVVSQQVYQISPFSEPTGVAVMEARQQLTLLEVRSERGSSPDVSMQSYGSLRYQFPSALPQMPMQLIKTKNPEQRIVETLQHIVQNNQQDFHDDVPHRFLELVQLCRLASADTLESIWRQFSDKPRYRRWLLSAVSASGTTEALKFIKARIRNDDLNYLQTLLSVSFALHLTKADEHSVPVAADLMTSSRVQRSPMLQQVACLGYSSVVNRYCSQTSACPKEALQPVHDLAEEAISKGREDKMKLALKCIGNIGEPASIKRILKFLPISSSSSSDIPVHVQIDAIMALRKIAQKDPKTVQGYLIQILADQSLPPEVRMMACAVIFETRPALPLITTIANVAMKESSLQVASFVYSHMKALSRSRLPFMYNISSACNIALKLLASKLDRLNYRYSKVMHMGHYFENYKVGAAGDVFVMNSPGTMFPSAIISKLMAYSAGSVADLVEVGVRVEGLTDVIVKRNIPFAEYPTYKKIKEIGKTLLGWKELPTEIPLISAYWKALGQEVAFININKEVLQQAVKTVLEPADRSSVIKRIASQIRNGIAGQWTQPVWLGELRYIVPTCTGLPLEYGLYTTALARMAVNVDGKMTPPLTGEFRPSQLLESTMQIRSDVNPSLYVHTVATMGVNTEYFQHAIEIQGKVLARAPMKFDAKIDMKLKNIKIETKPCHEETEIVVGRHKAFAVSRNIGEVGVEKRTSVLPEEYSPSIVEEPFKPSERASSEGFTMQGADSAPRKHAYSSQEDLHHGTGRKTHKRDICIKMHRLGCQLCFSRRSRDASFLKNTYLHRLIGEHEAKIVLMPVQTDADIDKIQLEIQAGSRAASKIIHVVNSESEEEDESFPYEDIQAKLKKILGIENVFKVANKTRHQKQQPSKKGNTMLTEIGTDPDAKNPSSSPSASSAVSSSSSSAASPDRKKAVGEDETGQVKQVRNKDASSSKSSSSSSNKSSSSSSSKSSSSSSSKSSSRSSNKSSSSSSSKSSSKSSSSSSKSSSSSSKSSSSSSNSSRSSSSSKSSSSSSSSKSSSHHSHGHHSKHLNGSSSSSSSKSSHHSHGHHPGHLEGGDSSSSSSEYSKIWEVHEIYHYRFRSAHRQEFPKRKLPGDQLSSTYSSTRSSRASSRAASRPKFLGDVKTPVLAVFLHGIRNDKKIGGLQLVVYADIDSIRPRVQVFVSNLTDASKWKLCADASVLNAHKAAAYLKWGRNCQDYKILTELVTGRFAAHPAVQVKFEWPKVPSSVRSIAEWFYKFVPGAAFMLGFSEKTDKNPSRQVRVIVALTSPRTCDVVVKLPDMILYEKAMRLPLSLPVGPRLPASELQPPIWNVFAEAPSAVIENLKACCSVSHNKITTFNEVKFNYTMPASCYHVLAQDCSSDLKFLVMMRKAEEAVDLKAINIKLGSHDIDMQPVKGQVKLLVDGVESPSTNVSYRTAGASLWIHSEKQGLVLIAPAYGIEKLYFDGYTFRIQVALWMAGKTCGICGKYDAECEQEYRMPNGYLAKNAVSFGHSWILEEKPCTGACKLRRSFVKLEKTVQLAGVESKCYSTEPVLRCMKGCSATKTTPVTVGFHCLPADSATSLTDKQTKFDQKSEDMQDTVDAHIACSCENEDCSA
ncbi:PREDICTED: RNA-binding protein with serine-rich domain 1 [Mesitornis unicolor]|uniref:RNA-binding protein with serine-rich domain 1 n=1 Tax=Mesitornis unicolor TaxID=54374 RepID=UPI0005288768|nr:PREDICTED: RNA-binding protein with serine-rich domain 1 [Mesitornis unicolor]